MCVAVVCAVLGGCEGAGKRKGVEEGMPKLGELRARVQEVEGGGAETARVAGPVVPVGASRMTMCQIARMDFPFQSDFSAARELLDGKVIPLDQFDLWRMNGLFVGVLEGGKVESFMKALPANQGGETTRLVTMDQRHVYAITPAIVGATGVVVSLPDGSENNMVLTRGRVQFLIRFRRGVGGEALVEVTPHHYYPAFSIEPRLPQEKELDGRIFEELMVTAPVGVGEVLVLGMELEPEPEQPAFDLPEEEPVDEEVVATPSAAANQPLEVSVYAAEAGGRKAAEKVVTTQPATQLAASQPGATQAAEELRVPRHLGALLLGFKRYKRPMQSLLMVRVEE